MIDPKEADAYIQKVLRTLETNPDKLTKEERNLAQRVVAQRNLAQKLLQDMDSLQTQIRQAETRVRVTELQVKEINGKVQAFMEYMIFLKFEQEEEPKKEISFEEPAPKKLGRPTK